MSYAAFNAPPPSEQPKQDPVPLNITHVVPDNDTVKVTAVLSDDTPASGGDHLELDPEDGFPSPESRFSRPSKGNKRLKELEAEGLYLWETAKHYLIRPNVGCGVLGLGKFPKVAVVIVPFDLENSEYRVACVGRPHFLPASAFAS